MRNRLLLLTALVALVGAPAMAFHDDGVADCSGCHTMHNSQDGAGMNMTVYDTPGSGTLPGVGYNDLLLFQNKSDVCLNCHDGSGSYHIWAADPLAPGGKSGGDFVFLQEDNINDGHGGASNPILGHASGHSVISVVKGTGVDPLLGTAPGGAFPSGDLVCTSCHDPHGTSSFRLTYQTGQTTTSATSYVINWNATIVADAISVFGNEAPANHNAYRSGYSNWCGNCHGDFHAASANLVHPSGELLDTIQVGIYNSYDGTKNCIDNPPGVGTPCGTGNYTTAYLVEVPIEEPDVLHTRNSTLGALDGTSGVACVSCHRSHATSAPDAGRWDFAVTGLLEDGEESGSYKIPNPYDEYQRSLCNKCHSKDEYDAPHDFTP